MLGDAKYKLIFLEVPGCTQAAHKNTSMIKGAKKHVFCAFGNTIALVCQPFAQASKRAIARFGCAQLLRLSLTGAALFCGRACAVSATFLTSCHSTARHDGCDVPHPWPETRHDLPPPTQAISSSGATSACV
eukprot:2367344-Amphidinium_carterae.1